MLLLVVNGLLLYMHYKEAGNATLPDGIQPAYSQEIEVVNRSDALYVRHHFIDLPDVRHEIIWPKASTERACHEDEEGSCSRLNEEATAFVEGEAGRQAITYVIPKDEPMRQTAFFTDVFATVDASVPEATMFHMTDEMKLGGLWVNGLELVGSQRMDLIDYSLFRGEGALTDLYWQEKELPLAYQGDRLAVFGQAVDTEELKEMDAALSEAGIPSSTLVVRDAEKPIFAKRFAVLRPEEIGMAGDTLLVNGLSSQYSLSSEEPMLGEVITSLVSGRAVGTEKSREMYEVLSNHLKENERIKLIESLKSFEGKSIDASILDDILEEVTGFATSFFKKNENNTQFYPLLLEDPRKVYVSGEENSEIAVILKDGKLYYPITSIMRQLGYDVSSNEQSLYIENEARKFRFPMKESFYVYNERRYNVNSVPFVRIEDEFYFEEAAFIRIFLVSIEKTGERLDVSPIAIFGKEGDK